MTQPPEQPTPWTKAGKALLDLLYEEDSSFTAREVLHAILAIEAEAAAPDPPASPPDLEASREQVREAVLLSAAHLDLLQGRASHEKLRAVLANVSDYHLARLPVASPAPLDAVKLADALEAEGFVRGVAARYGTFNRPYWEQSAAAILKRLEGATDGND